jgi:hypothetical protein
MYRPRGCVIVQRSYKQREILRSIQWCANSRIEECSNKHAVELVGGISMLGAKYTSNKATYGRPESPSLQIH